VIIFNAFAAGLAFVAGLVVGIFTFAPRKKRELDKLDDHYKAVEARLSRSMEAHERIAASMEELTYVFRNTTFK